MSYILSAQRNPDCTKAFLRYEEYLRDHQRDFPESAYKLATSDWWHDFENHRCPHDSWLEDVKVIEIGKGDRQQFRSTDISVKLLGAFHDGYIELRYKNVKTYEIRCDRESHGDWLYDQFTGMGSSFKHEIEWSGGAMWIIEAEDIDYAWKTKM